MLGLDAPTRFEIDQMSRPMMNALIAAAQAGDPRALAALRQITDRKEAFLPAWFQWWNNARLPLACTPSDVAKMTPEELAKAAQGELTQVLLEEIRERAAGDSDPTAE